MQVRFAAPQRLAAALLVAIVFAPAAAEAQVPVERGVTSLANKQVKYQAGSDSYAVLRASGVQAVIVDNSAVDDDTLPGHRAGYSGLASLRHQDAESLIVPAYAGLNFEHIHDGTNQNRDILFEPRRAPMQLRKVDDRTVELYQAPTPHWGLESCHRYQMLEDGTLELTFECVAHRETFTNGYIGLFWASYIHQPESLDIHFIGKKGKQPDLSGEGLGSAA